MDGCEWMDELMNGWMDGWTDVNGWRDGVNG